MSQIITVFGATGNQGGSVIKHILADSDLHARFSIRGVTRDVSKPAAQALTKQGVEMITANLNSASSVSAAVKGTSVVFLVTNFWETASKDTEVSQGRTVVDACKEAGVRHFIFSSLVNATEVSGGRLSKVAHFDGKAEIEQYARDSDVPSTFYLPGYFMSNFAGMSLKKGEDGSYTLMFPVSEEAKFPLVDIAADTGKFVKAIIKKRDQVLGKRVLGAEDYYTPTRIVQELEQAIGKKVTYLRVPNESFARAMPEFMAQEMLENHLLIEAPGYYGGASLDESHAVLEDKLVNWKEYIQNSGSF